MEPPLFSIGLIVLVVAVSVIVYLCTQLHHYKQNNLALISSHQSQVLYLQETIAQHEIQLALEADNQYFLNRIINAMPSALIGVDTQSRVTHWNEQAAQTTGILAASALGKYLFDIVPSIGIKPALLAQSISSNTVLTVERLRDDQNETERYKNIVVFPLNDAHNGAVIRIDDITKRVNLESQLIQSEKLSSLSALAAGLPHEINGPLAAISQYAQLTQRKLDRALGRLGDAQAPNVIAQEIEIFLKGIGISDSLNKIRESTAQAANIVENMLTFARPATSHFELTNIAALISKSVEVAKLSVNNRELSFQDVQIKLQLDENLPHVQCAPSEIQQVFVNIIRNSIEAFPPAEQSERDTAEILIQGRCHADYVEVVVTDEGQGMTSEQRQQLFRPFYTTKKSGTGLGLYISHLIIEEQHSGQLLVDSTPNIGTTFTIRLPIIAATSTVLPNPLMEPSVE